MDNPLPQLPPQIPTPPPSAPAAPPRATTPAPPPRKGGRGWMILSLFLGAILLLTWIASLLSMFTGMGGGIAQVENKIYEVHVVKPSKDRTDDKIALIEINGVIMSLGGGAHDPVTLIKDQLRLASKDDDVKAVILKVDSPGGEVLASDDIYRAIREFQKEHKKPVIACMGSLAASGGYYVSAPCRWIVANELTLTGSIGVIMQSINFRGLMDKVGVEPMTFKSGKFKDMLSSTKKPEEILPEEKRMLQTLIDEVYGKFQSIVEQGRGEAKTANGSDGRALVANWKDFADGRIFSGKQALELGYVDELGTLDTALARARKIAGISDATLIKYQPPFDFGSLFRLLGQSEAKSVKIDIGMDVPRLQLGRLYFISTSVIP
ncbi:MAG: signal peptide peptidase SppA [Verrucomicrobia bacterium]|nr:signal peptide peptidase SppA [Verrucomicrobiota bacterium]